MFSWSALTLIRGSALPLLVWRGDGGTAPLLRDSPHNDRLSLLSFCVHAVWGVFVFTQQP